MKTPKCDVTAKHIYSLVENFVLSLLTEICTSFGIMEFPLTATMSSHHLEGLGASKSKGPFFQNPHNPKALCSNHLHGLRLPRNEVCVLNLLRAGCSAVSFLTVYKEKWVLEIWEQHTWKHNCREKLNMLQWIFMCHVIYMTFLEFLAKVTPRTCHCLLWRKRQSESQHRRTEHFYKETSLAGIQSAILL